MKTLFSIAAVIGLACSAFAQSPVVPKIYPLTNSTTFTIALGGTNIAGSGTATINSAPFPVWRGRGFVVNTACVATNAGTEAMTYTFQFATPFMGQTNWNTAQTLAFAVALNGTTKVFMPTNIQPTIVDNVTLGRLQTIANGHASTVTIDATNNFISVIP